MNHRHQLGPDGGGQSRLKRKPGSSSSRRKLFFLHRKAVWFNGSVFDLATSAKNPEAHVILHLIAQKLCAIALALHLY